MKLQHVLVLLFIVLFACKSKAPKQDLQVAVAPQDTVQVAKTPNPTPPPVAKIDMGVNLDDKYFLVVDSYTVKEFAESWNKKYQQQGFNSAVIMRNEDGYYRVALQSFKDFELAQKALKVLREEDEFKKAWIMIINK